MVDTNQPTLDSTRANKKHNDQHGELIRNADNHMNHQSILAKAFQFSLDTVRLNSISALSTEQQQLLKTIARTRRFFIILSLSIFGVISFIFILTPFWLSKKTGYTQPDMFYAFWGTASVVMILVSLSCASGYYKSRHIRKQTMHTIKGRPTLSTKKIKRLRMTAYYATIGNVYFQLHSEVQFKALDPSRDYTVHYIPDPPAHLILSISH